MMEDVAGGDLAQLIAAEPIREDAAVAHVEQVCGTLAYAHVHGSSTKSSPSAARGSIGA